MRVPLADVLAWPDSHVRLQLAFLAKEPPAEERIELAVADLMALTFNVNRGQNTPAKSGPDFLRFMDPWKSETVDTGLSADELKLKARLKSKANP